MKQLLQKIAEDSFQDELEKIAVNPLKSKLTKKVVKAVKRIAESGKRKVENVAYTAHGQTVAAKELTKSYLKDPHIRGGAIAGGAITGLGLLSARQTHKKLKEKYPLGGKKALFSLQ